MAAMLRWVMAIKKSSAVVGLPFAWIGLDNEVSFFRVFVLDFPLTSEFFNRSSIGHRDITVFVPKWRKESARPDNPIKDQEILNELERERILVYTPSRSLTNGKRMVCYDDRYILKLAVDNDGIVVSNDNYRDLLQESNEFKKVVEERILMYSFVNDRFMPPDDPLGKLGPTLDNFLKFQPK